MRTPNHTFHGFATGFGARIEKPVRQQVCEASTALTPIGGRAGAASRDYLLQDLFSFKEATSSVLGHFYLRERRDDSFTAETRVSAAVTGLVVPGVLSADRISMALVTERDFSPESPRRFRVEEARIDCLRAPTLKDGGCFDYDASRDSVGALKRLSQQVTKDQQWPGATKDQLRAELKRGEMAEGVYWSLSHQAGDCGPMDPRKPVFTVVKGDTTFEVFLVELLITDKSIDLTMLRIEMSSNPGGGSATAASGGINGNPST
jgi:hypothetical protein